MNKLAPRRVADLVASALPQMAERLQEVRLRTRWASIVGPDVARRTQPGRLDHGCLTITVNNSPWLHELTLRQGELAARLGEHLPEIRALRFVIGTVASESGARRTHVPRPPRLTADEVREIENTVSVIRDDEVASAARRLLTTARRFSRSRGAVS
jgi:hypothetical protein